MSLSLISVEGKLVHIYFKPIKQTWVIATDASPSRAGGTYRGLSNGSQWGAGCPVATVTGTNTDPDKTGGTLVSGSRSWGHVCLPTFGEVAGTLCLLGAVHWGMRSSQKHP